MGLQLLNTRIGQLRLIGFLEGMSFLVLLLIAMPLKYFWQLPEAVRVIGMAHGILFLLYNFYVLVVHLQKQWTYRELGFAIAASFIPLGTFYADSRVFRKYAERE